MERRAHRARADAEKVAEGLGRSVYACMHACMHVSVFERAQLDLKTPQSIRPRAARRSDLLKAVESDSNTNLKQVARCTINHKPA